MFYPLLHFAIFPPLLTDNSYKYMLKNVIIFISYGISPQNYPNTGYKNIFLSSIIDIHYKYTARLYKAFVRAKN